MTQTSLESGDDALFCIAFILISFFSKSKSFRVRPTISPIEPDYSKGKPDGMLKSGNRSMKLTGLSFILYTWYNKRNAFSNELEISKVKKMMWRS